MKTSSKYIWIFNGVFALVLLVYILYNLFFPSFQATFPDFFVKDSTSEYRHIALGDSYSIGEGISKEYNWPNQLERELQGKGVDFEVIANPSKTGYTTEDLIKYELPVLEVSKANVVSVQIGVNDWVKGVSKEKFRDNFNFILERVNDFNPKTFFVVLIPDFSLAPNSYKYSLGRNISQGIKEYNNIIKEESFELGVEVVDINNVSTSNNSNMFASDGLHPSKEQYSLWVRKIVSKISFD